MLGLFGTLSLGARSMQTQQTGVEVAGQHLPNINNPTYARQRVTAPEDDPAAMGESLKLQARARVAGQYAKNIATLQAGATTVINALQSLKTISDRAGEIATQADGTKSASDLQNYANEVKQLIEQALQFANSKDGNQYVFAGTSSGQAPFTATTDSNGSVTSVNYLGDTSVAQTEISQGMTLSVDAPGQNNTGTGPRGVLSDSRYGVDFFNHLIALQNNLQAGNTTAIQSTDHAALASDADNIIYQTANMGVVQSHLDVAASDSETNRAALQQSLTSVAGADLTTKLAQLSQTQTAYQAALASSAQLLHLQQTLLNYLP